MSGGRPPRRRRAQAAALGYDPRRDRAPRLLAKGEGLLADRLVAIAREHGIPVHEDAALVGVLSRLDLQEHIPPALYLVVAEILGYLYRAQAEARARQHAGPT